jgi:glycosyltransferase involved in cell wall biosynthesis
MSTKLLIVGDAGRPTGFEKVVRNVATQLHLTGKYDITIRGLGYDPKASHRVYPVTVKSADTDRGDPVGISKVDEWVKEDQPDIMLSVIDLWAVCGYATFKPVDLPYVAYFPVDTPNVIWGNALGLAGVSAAATYTHFGARETAVGVRDFVGIMHERLDQPTRAGLVPQFAVPKFGAELQGRLDRLARYQEPAGFSVIPHGFEHGVFEPRDQATARRKFGLPPDAFVITNVGTNQFRKRLDLTMRAFARVKKGVPHAVLVLHCAGYNPASLDGYNLRQLARLYGVHESVYLTHERFGDLSDDNLCWLYNTADININTSGGEGWGLCSIESGACGVPQVVPDWSGTREIWEGHAALIPIVDYRIEPKSVLNTAHAVIDHHVLANTLVAYAQSTTAQVDAERSVALACVQKQPSWVALGGQFDALLQRALLEPPPEPMSFDQLLAGRVKPNLASEIANWL